jgi:hypothetical protein
MALKYWTRISLLLALSALCIFGQNAADDPKGWNKAQNLNLSEAARPLYA